MHNLYDKKLSQYLFLWLFGCLMLDGLGLKCLISVCFIFTIDVFFFYAGSVDGVKITFNWSVFDWLKSHCMLILGLFEASFDCVMFGVLTV